MNRLSLPIPRKAAPGILAASLLFVAISDADASCLAAWLCPPPARAECEHESSSGPVWQTAPELCAYESRVERFSQKLDALRLDLQVGTVAPWVPSSPHVPKSSFHVGASLHPTGASARPLYVLQASLLI